MVPQAIISSRLRKHPRQISSSSRQQLRTQGEGTGTAGGMTDRPDRSGINIDVLAGCICSFFCASHIPSVLVATRVKNHRNLLATPVTALATFALIPIVDALARCLRMFADPSRVNGRIRRNRVNSARNGRLAVLGPEALHAVVFVNRCYPLHESSI